MKRGFILLMILVFGLCLPVFTSAETPEENPLLPNALLPGKIEGTGTYFEVTDSEYLNIILESSEAITLRLESVPEMVTMHIESASGAISTQITISGFQPLTTYYKYEDDYHNEETFTTDENGRYTYTQDLSRPHLVFIQPRKSTKFIRDDATGGDCTSIGIWDWATKTCTLTTDVNETIQIDSDYITLDGNGHTITGTGTGYGVYLYGRTGVTIKNVGVKNFTGGIALLSSSNNTLYKNTALKNITGIGLSMSRNNILVGNIADANITGVFLDILTGGSTLIANTMSNNKYNFTLYAGTDFDYPNNIDTSNTVDGRPIYYIVGATNQVYDSSTNAGTFYCIFCNNVLIKDLTLTNNGYGIFFWKTYKSRIENVSVSNSGGGLALFFSNDNVLTDNTIFDNGRGIAFYYSNDNTLTNHTVSNNWYKGIDFTKSDNNQLTNNTVSNTYYGSGISLYASNNNIFADNTISNNNRAGIGIGMYSSKNKLYNNNFIDNLIQASVGDSDSIDNIFNLDAPTGGNYWSDFDTPSEGCYDTNNDGFCDAPYRFYGGADYLPWSKQSGWKVPVDIIPPTITITATPNILWPPNHKMVDVTIDGSATDNESGIKSIKINVTDEYGIYNLTVPQFGSTIQLEAWREGTDKNGRVYTISVVATDNAGNQASATTQVVVPHDMRK